MSGPDPLRELVDRTLRRVAVPRTRQVTAGPENRGVEFPRSFADERHRGIAGLRVPPPSREAAQPSARYWVGLIMLSVAASIVIFAALAREPLTGVGDALVAAALVPALIGVALVGREFWLSLRAPDITAQ